MNILKINPAHPEPDLLNQAAGIILRGGVIGYPTETVYGLGANAYNSSAISKVFELKAREATKPILVIAGNTEMVKKLITSFPESAARLAGVFWPGPLTLVFAYRAIRSVWNFSNGVAYLSHRPAPISQGKGIRSARWRYLKILETIWI
jgi:L-threonylcarbamoyladenylate synthase